MARDGTIPETASTAEGIPRLWGIAREQLAAFPPAYFALVMATGIVSLACHFVGFDLVAVVLLWLNVAAFVWLLIVNCVRVVLFPGRVLADLADYRRGVGFFTLVAACCILGSQFQTFDQLQPLAVGFWCAGIVLWCLTTYVVLGGFIIRPTKRSLPEGIHGGWLAVVVATQSIAILGTTLADAFSVYREHVLFYCLAMWLAGGMIYIWIISLIVYRYWFFRVRPADLSAASWINMGAMAISTLAGANLIAHAKNSPLLGPLHPFLEGFTLFYWSTATWWIPMLMIIGIWRHARRRFRYAYDPLAWEAVFPIGMYTACTDQLAVTLQLPFLLVIPRAIIYVALIMWLVTFCGMLASMANIWVQPARRS
jgi:tellurite resistance protein TehA-like permease